MVDINPLPLPLPHEPPPKKIERSVDADAFHKEMHKRVEKVTETDQEQKKKRKRKEEAEEEEEPKEAVQGPPTPPATTFSMGDEKAKVSPLEMGKGPGVSPLSSAQQSKILNAPKPGTSQAPLMGASAPPSSDEMEDDSGLLEETAFMETIPPEEAPSPAASPTYPSAPAPEEEISYPTPTPYPEQAAPPPSSQPPAPTPEKPAAAPAQPEEKTPESESSQEKQKKKPVQAGPPAPPAKPKKAAAPAERPRIAPAAEKRAKPSEEKGLTAEEIEEMKETAGTEETGGFFEQFAEEKEKGVKKEVKPTETPEEREGLEGLVTPVAPLTPSDYIEKEKKEEEEVAALGLGGAPPGMEAPPAPAEAAPAGINNPYANLHPAVMDLFDRMVGTMSVMTLSGITETTVTLDAPKFASSVFFGSQIIIQEYSSAPHAFNIQLNGSPEAVALFKGNADDLMAAFQYGNYNFRVNRLETGLLREKPLIRRKGPPSGGKEDQRR